MEENNYSEGLGLGDKKKSPHVSGIGLCCSD
jgi:hypothetical protein